MNTSTLSVSDRPRVRPAAEKPPPLRLFVAVQFSPTDAAVTVAVIDEAAAELSKCYDHLTPQAKASALTLAQTLSNLRRRFIEKGSK